MQRGKESWPKPNRQSGLDCHKRCLNLQPINHKTYLYLLSHWWKHFQKGIKPLLCVFENAAMDLVCKKSWTSHEAGGFTHQSVVCGAVFFHSACVSLRTSFHLDPESTRLPDSIAAPGLLAGACEWSICRMWHWFYPTWDLPLPSSVDKVLQSVEQSPWTEWPAPEVGQLHPQGTWGTNRPTGVYAALWFETPHSWAVMCHPPLWTESGEELLLSTSQGSLKKMEKKRKLLSSSL